MFRESRRSSLIILLIIIAVVVSVILYVKFRDNKQAPEEPNLAEENEPEGTIPYDVSEAPQVKGEVQAAFYNNAYSLKAVFYNLPYPPKGYFYEGWIVKGQEYISTGIVGVDDGAYTNVFGSDSDFTDYSHYMLTLEPRNSDSSPAATVLKLPIEIIEGKHAF